MPSDSFIDYLGDLFKHRTGRKTRVKKDDTRPLQADVSSGKISVPAGFREQKLLPSGPFAHAHHFTLANPVLAETINMFSNGYTVLQHLAPYTTPEAAVDSIARWPPPACHPGTRVTIGNKLIDWLDDSSRKWCMIWIYGPAGCGKSAVAQTFAERCADVGRLGAAFFFSRPNKRNDPKTVIPTIAYQLSVHCADYKAVLTSRLADDPQLLSKALSVQFKKLIVEPLTYLQTQQYESVRRPYLVFLDGLDECQGEDAQCEFVKLINEVVRVKKDLPLLWLICSRPEAHLQSTFARLTDCGREELEIDDECRGDVDRYLRDGLFDIRMRYGSVIPSSWPPREQFDVVSRSGSGYFIFAATALGYIDDSVYANPVQRLNMLVAFLEQTEGTVSTSNNPLAKVDLLYSYILADIPDDIFPITWRILAHYIYRPQYEGRGEPPDWLLPDLPSSTSVQELCNFLDLDQIALYSALRKLYSVVDVPSPEKAQSTPLRFYHASFQDFLVDGNRSGKFVVEREKAFVEISKTCLFWHEIDSRHFHVAAGPWGKRSHRHASLPGLKWVVSEENARDISQRIAEFATDCWIVCSMAFDGDINEELPSCLRALDYRYLVLDFDWVNLVDYLYTESLFEGFIRTEPLGEYDIQLLQSMKTMCGQENVRPASFPLRWTDSREGCSFREYLLIGNGPKSAVVWFTVGEMDDGMLTKRRVSRMDCLRCGEKPSQERIVEYQQWLREVNWIDESHSVSSWNEYCEDGGLEETEDGEDGEDGNWEETEDGEDGDWEETEEGDESEDSEGDGSSCSWP